MEDFSPGGIGDSTISELDFELHFNPDGSKVEVPVGTKIGEGVCLRENITLGRNVTIEDGVIVGDNVEIGNNTIIHSDSILSDNSTVGASCIVGKNVRIRPLANVPNCWQLRDDAVANHNPSEADGPAFVH